MTNLEVREFISTIRRQLFLSALMRFSLLILVTSGIVAMPFYASENRPSDILWAVSLLAGLTWISLTFLSVKQLRAANQGVVYLADGRLDLAADQFSTAALQFSLFRVGKLRACHNLAVVAHGRGKFEEAAQLLDAVLQILRRPDQTLTKTTRLLLADCRLSLGDATTANEVLAPILTTGQRQSLTEQLLLLPIQIRCQVAIGDFKSAVDNLPWKLKRAELLDSPRAAQVHALLSEACRQTARLAEANFLMTRAHLYADLSEIMDERPGLRDLLFSTTSADNI